MIDMGMAGDHLLRERIADVGHIKLLLLFSNLRIETDVKQNIA